ncbi:MAG: alpha/beta hydrolase [Chloroflexi bacterium]|nr:alpha/beta hydrolase [Chloroflexota bacterium]
MTADKHAASLWVSLMGSQVRMVKGKQYKHRVIEAGEGDALILIHGVGSSAELFARNVMPLAEHFHVYAIDALYHGYSTLEPYDSGLRVRVQADAILDFMDAEGIQWAHFEGESMGAGMAFDIGMRYPERSGKMIFNSGSFYVSFKREFEAGPEADLLVPICQESVNNFSRDTVRKRMEYLVASPDHLTDDLVDVQYKLYQDPAIFESMRKVYGVSAPRPRLLFYEEEEAATFKPESLVMWTDRNQGASPELGEYLASRIGGGAQYVLIKNAAHWPQWEQPEEHNRVVTDFLLGKM